MKKIFKRVSAAVMALAVMLTAVVFDVPEKLVAAAVGNLDTDGYQLDDDGKLTIKNDDGMTNWTNVKRDYGVTVKSIEIQSDVTSISARAFDTCKYFTSISILEGVTEIGSYAFSGCSMLPSITIPESVTKIGNYAFYGCSKLRDINIPDSVRTINTGVFSGCSGLSSITIPDRVTSIGNSAFYRCSMLQNIDIPASVTSIGSRAFGGCSSLARITVDENNSMYSSEGGVLFNKDKKALVYYPGGKEGDSYQVPNNVTSIQSYAFSDCERLKSITIPNSVTSIGTYAFADCSSIESVTFSDGSRLLAIIDNTFYGCKNLSSINIPDSVTSIGADAFASCAKLQNITIPASVKTIDISDKGSPFRSCSLLTAITVEAGNTAYSSANGVLFDKDKKLICCPGGKDGSYEIPSGVTSIETGAFYDCTKLTSVIIPSGVTSIGSKSFYFCKELASVTIPDGVTTIGNYAFQSCSVLTSVTIPSSVTSIGNSAFSSCTNLSEIIYPSSATLGSSAIYPKATQVKYTETDSKRNVTEIALGTGKTSLTVTDAMNIVSVAEGERSKVAKTGHTHTYSDYVCQICGAADNKCGDNATWSYDEATKTLTISGTGAMTDWEKKDNVPWADKAADIQKVVIDNGITSIGERAFYDCKNLASIEIPNTVTSIKTCAFINCQKLASITIPGGVTSIENNVFQNCSSLSSITIPDNVTSIGVYAFDSTSLSSIIIPEKVTSIGLGAFSHCENLTSITIPKNVTTITNAVFFCCTNLETVTFENATPPTPMGTTVFKSCDKLTKIIVPAGSVEDYKAATGFTDYADIITDGTPDNKCGDNATWAYDEATNTLTISGTGDMTNWTDTTSVPWADKAANIQKVVIEDGITSIGDNAFNGCSSLTNVTISKDVTTIGKGAFNGCSNLANVTLPDSVTTISSGAFMSCTSLTGITIPKNVTTIGNNAFDSCTNLKTVTFEGTTPPTTIGSNVFNECSSDLTINVPEGTKDAYKTKLADLSDKVTDGTPDNKCGANATWALDETTKTLTISGTGDMTDWTDTTSAPWADKAADIEKVVIGDGITSIGDNAFEDCTSLTDVTIPDSVTDIGNGAFDGCTSLTEVTIPEGVENISDNAFAGCTELGKVTFEGENPPTMGSDVFKDCAVDKIVVPDGSEDAYKNESGFTGLTDKITDNNGGNDNSCGTNATWEYDETTKTLTVNGTGDMNDWTAEDPAPWADKAADIEKVVIGDGITSIGDNAFEDCTTLTEVTIPDSVAEIGDGAFDGCTSLTEVTIPDGVENISDNAFAGCTDLEKVTFEGETPPIMGSDVFKDCAVDKIVVPDGSEDAYKNESGFTGLTDKITDNNGGNDNSCGTNATWEYDETTKTLTISGTGDMTDWTAEDSAPWADKAADIEKVVIDDGITSIGDNAFEDCTTLTEVTIPDSVTEIGDGAFDGCTSLTEVTIPKGVENIGDNAFAGCTDLETVTFEGKNPPAIGSDVFDGCDVDKIVVPEGSEDTYKGENGFTDLTGKITSGTGDNSGSDDGNTDKPENPGDNDDNNNNDSGNSSGGSESNDSGNSGDTGNNSSDNENTSKDVLLGENVPKTDFATPTEELISAVLDPEEITQIKNSDEVSIVLEISDTVSNEDKQKVESALETNAELRFAQYMDIALYKVINDIKTQVTTTNKPIRITFEVPANLRKSGRTFGVYRVHNGETVLLPDLDNDENTVTIETDRFSTYALVYRDKASASESGNPSTGIAVSLIPLVTAAAILMIMTNRKKK